MRASSIILPLCYARAPPLVHVLAWLFEERIGHLLLRKRIWAPQLFPHDAVISDGAPSSKNAVKKAIKEATKKMTRPDELKITFLQVGNEEGCANFLCELDFDLAHQGARTDIVGARDFRQLLYTGLPAALAASVSDRPY